MASVLGRITTSSDSPRGPDVKHRIRVKKRWLEHGDAIEFPLPRNLACAKCEGGGCDTCGGAGALSLRDRDAPDELVRVVLPETPASAEGKRHAVAIRIPERGGIAQREQLPRGMLILTVIGDKASDEGVRKVHPSLVPPPADVVEDRLIPGQATPAARGISWPLVVLATLIVWLLLLAALRALGAF